MFIAARVVEGLGGAAVLACGLAILANDFPDAARRTHATAVWGTSVGLGISLGALLSAVAGAARWREPYLVVGVLALILLWPSSLASASRVRRAGVDSMASGWHSSRSAMVLLRLRTDLRQGRHRRPHRAARVRRAGGVARLRLRRAAGARPADRPEPAAAQPISSRHDRIAHPRCRRHATVSFVPTLAQVGLGSGLWTASLLVVAWSGTSVATAYLSRHVRHPMEGPVPIAVSLVVVAVGQALGYGIDSESSPWRLVPVAGGGGRGDRSAQRATRSRGGRQRRSRPRGHGQRCQQHRALLRRGGRHHAVRRDRHPRRRTTWSPAGTSPFWCRRRSRCSGRAACRSRARSARTTCARHRATNGT